MASSEQDKSSQVCKGAAHQVDDKFLDGIRFEKKKKELRETEKGGEKLF